MLDLKFIRENPEAVRKGARDKNIRCDIDSLLKLDGEFRPLQIQLEQLQAERNSLSKTIGKAPADERDALKEKVATIKAAMEKIEVKVNTLQAEMQQQMLLIPQPARADVPIGNDDGDNVEVRRSGNIPEFRFPPKDHVELGQMHDIIDIPRGVKLAGSRSYFLKGDGARLEQAVMRYTFDKLLKKNYTPFSVPVLVSEQAMIGTGYFPTGREQAYYVEKDELALVGTGEVSLASYHFDEILPREKLPLRFMTQSSCFRREAGTYGKDAHGLYRVHQFQKIEQVIIAPADVAQSDLLHEELLQNAEEILQDLGLAYRVVYVCTGDLGQGQVRKHDIETWMPSRKSYSETHSCSSFYDFQARRLKMRYKDSTGKTVFCYTLNNTAVASPRILIPLLETYQQQDGSITIPECLRSYMGGQARLG